jgi:hypothetical protein
MSMKLHRRYSKEPLVELRLDYASPDGRTLAQRPYLWFHQLEDGSPRERLKVIPLSVEDAVWFVEQPQFQTYLLEASGQPDAIHQIHQFFLGCGFDVRSNRGKAPRKNESRTTLTRSKVGRFLLKLAFWRKEAV